MRVEKTLFLMVQYYQTWFKTNFICMWIDKGRVEKLYIYLCAKEGFCAKISKKSGKIVWISPKLSTNSSLKP